ncbi:MULTISPECIES: hypothetical protein [unclassified Pseudoalteromonas]|uniref:hypothetical protein n=1 Tax=unclassified Pseudoalteromonas TaxID=194690 RepID=UPI000C07A113|nr:MULTISPECIES: hypothetical protein [unclassified Pseudoalteromonas]MDP2636170.1 hypothetical protein [Pseudoalteromonas sp. 1_MG-2023]PHN89344.1 hypothetical protein CSC79_12775 [Pseudoalteromonas sp. 3D05]
MIIDYFVNKPQQRVEELTEKMDFRDELKRQHHQALNYRLKRFAVTNVGIASAFTAGAGYQALKNNDSNQSKLSKLSKFTWLLRFI